MIPEGNPNRNAPCSRWRNECLGKSRPKKAGLHEVRTADVTAIPTGVFPVTARSAQFCVLSCQAKPVSWSPNCQVSPLPATSLARVDQQRWLSRHAGSTSRSNTSFPHGHRRMDITSRHTLPFSRQARFETRNSCSTQRHESLIRWGAEDV